MSMLEKLRPRLGLFSLNLVPLRMLPEPQNREICKSPRKYLARQTGRHIYGAESYPFIISASILEDKVGLF